MEFLTDHYRYEPTLSGSCARNADFDSIMRKYREWCSANGYYAVGKNKLGEAIKRCFPGAIAERRTIPTIPYGPHRKITAYIGLVEDI